MIHFVKPFSSFDATLQGSKTFSVTVELCNGKVIATDPFPLDPNNPVALTHVTDMIAHAMEEQTYFALWCRNKKAIVTIAAREVSTVSVSLNS